MTERAIVDVWDEQKSVIDLWKQIRPPPLCRSDIAMTHPKPEAKK